VHDDKPRETCFKGAVREEHRKPVRGKRLPGESKQTPIETIGKNVGIRGKSAKRQTPPDKIKKNNDF
jgi:hypothetical protein